MDAKVLAGWTALAAAIAIGLALALPFSPFLWANAVMYVALEGVAFRHLLVASRGGGCRSCGSTANQWLPDGSCMRCGYLAAKKFTPPTA